MKKVLLLSVCMVFVLSGCSLNFTQTEMMGDKKMPELMAGKMMDDGMMKGEEGSLFRNKMVLKNVSKQENPEGNGFYDVMEGETRAFASFKVDAPGEGFFYEGWLVCNKKPYSTGELFLEDGYYNNWFSSKDLPENCQKYVLTIEPDDNDPAPADHVMDGKFQKLGEDDMSMLWNHKGFQM